MSVQRNGAAVRTGAAALFLLVVGGAVAWWMLSGRDGVDFNESVKAVVALIRSWGAWGVAGSIGLMMLHSFLPFPAEIVACANGMIYGPVWGTVVTWVGAMLGASIAFALGRWLGYPFVRSILSARRREMLADWSLHSGARVLLISRLIPVIAFNLINYAAALTEIRWWTFLWVTAIGILPLTIAMAVVGDAILTMPFWVWLLLGALTLAGAVAIHRRARER
jgi:uncharacterized membrane protein YdjX (TVP38/TMEM64 family)